MELLLLKMHLTQNGWEKTKRVYEVIEKPSTYIFRNSRVNKNKIMKPDNIFRKTHHVFRLECYCLPDQEVECFDEMYKIIKQDLDQVISEVEAIKIFQQVQIKDIPVIVKEI